MEAGMKRWMVLVLFFGFLCLATSVSADDDDEELVFQQVVEIKIDGEVYYLHGPNGTHVVPGHTWAKTGKKKLIGKHFNSGPNGESQWWSSDANDGALLYLVDARLDEWSMEKSYKYYMKGYSHYHHLVSAEDGSMHPTKVMWLKHIATIPFTLDGGPHPDMAHEVKPGVDFAFVPNWDTPYMPGHGHGGH